MSFDQRTTLHFIAEYMQRELLWNSNNQLYYHMEKKEKAWKEMSEVLDISVNELKKKMVSLRGAYRREKSRIRGKMLATGRKSGDIAPQWFAYNAMSFLDGHIPTKLMEFIDENIKKEYDNCLLDVEDHTVTEDGMAISDPLSYDGFEETGKENENATEKVVVKVESNDTHCDSKDECLIFGEYITNKIKKLDDDLRAVAQHKINNILFELEMTQINRRVNSHVTK